MADVVMVDAHTAVLRRFQLRRSVDALVREEFSDADSTRADASGNTVLHAVASLSSESAAARVVDRGVAMLEQRNVHGMSALHEAARAGNAAALRELVRVARAHLTAEALQQLLAAREWNGRMFTALHFAVASGSRECVSVLLSAGADASLLDLGGLSPAVLAANRQPHLLPLLSRDWFAQPWAPALHPRWPVAFAEDALFALLVMRRCGPFARDVRLLVVVALGELYREKKWSTRVQKITPM